MFIKNTWYIAAEPSELVQKPLARTILCKPIVLFRTESGRLVALDDRCPHRFVPLSLGRVSGECIQCGYHGAKFNTAGEFVAVPGQEVVPPRTSLTSDNGINMIPGSIKHRNGG